MNSYVSLWRDTVQKFHEQSLRAQDFTSFEEPLDFWKNLTHFFIEDPYRPNDSELNALNKFVGAKDSILDVGGGAGRLALPLALKASRVEVVESSTAMLESLKDAAQKSGIQNINTVQSDWMNAKSSMAEIVLCAHVIYNSAEIAEFLDKLILHAKREVILLTFVSSPMSWLSPFWELIYDEQRIELPGMKEIVNVLWEMNIFPDIEMITPSYVSEWLEHSPEGEVRPRTYLNLQEAVEHIAPRLFISPGSPQEKILTDAILKLMSGDNGLCMNSEKISQRVAIIRWRT